MKLSQLRSRCRPHLWYQLYWVVSVSYTHLPVIAFNSVDEALPLCKALAEGGLPAAEVTFRTRCV